MVFHGWERRVLRGILYFAAGLCFVAFLSRPFTSDARRERAAGRELVDFDMEEREVLQTTLVLFVVSVGALAVSARVPQPGD